MSNEVNEQDMADKARLAEIEESNRVKWTSKTGEEWQSKVFAVTIDGYNVNKSTVCFRVASHDSPGECPVERFEMLFEPAKASPAPKAEVAQCQMMQTPAMELAKSALWHIAGLIRDDDRYADLMGFCTESCDRICKALAAMEGYSKQEIEDFILQGKALPEKAPKS